MKYIKPIVFICFVVIGLILLLFFMLDPVQDRLLIFYAICAMLAVVIGIIGAVVVNLTLGRHVARRRKALLLMGKDGFKAVMRDRVARIAYKGVYEFVKGNLPMAEEYFTKAMDLSDIRQNQIFCIEWLIHVHESYNDNSRLLWCYRKAVEFAPDNPETQSRLGRAYMIEGRLDRALYCFEQALYFDPNHGFSTFNIAKIKMFRGEDEEALRILEELSQRQQNHPLVFSELAVICAIMGDEEKSHEYYKKAIMCGYDNPTKLSSSLTAIKKFNNADDADGSDLPTDYYRRIVKEEEKKPKCSSSCEYCSLNKKCEKDDNDAGNE